jgi:DNA-binding XRE family transcriptional regulator
LYGVDYARSFPELLPAGQQYHKKVRNGIFRFALNHARVLTVHHPRYLALRTHMKALRRSAGLTQATLADRLKIDQSHVSKIERGDRYVDVLLYVDWCQACGLHPEETIVALSTAHG